MMVAFGAVFDKRNEWLDDEEFSTEQKTFFLSGLSELVDSGTVIWSFLRAAVSGKPGFSKHSSQPRRFAKYCFET